MIDGFSPLVQCLFATLFTWGLTALGSAVVFFFNGYKRTFLDASLGFAAGVMTAASFWSLLLPALEITEQQLDEDHNNKFLALIPVLTGFFLGAGFVYFTDLLLPENFIDETVKEGEKKMFDISSGGENPYEPEINDKSIRQRPIYDTKSTIKTNSDKNLININVDFDADSKYKPKNLMKNKFRKIILLIVAVTVHNIPEGLAVGVGFGAVGKTKKATFQNARNLAIGIGIQNFPEGLAVSLPLYASGFSYWRSFWYGQLSGMVEPLAGLLGTLAVGVAQSCLPYTLAFAAGAMLYVVFENIMPEASSHGNSKLSTWFCMIGFCVMMCLDVGLS